MWLIDKGKVCYIEAIKHCLLSQVYGHFTTTVRVVHTFNSMVMDAHRSTCKLYYWKGLWCDGCASNLYCSINE